MFSSDSIEQGIDVEAGDGHVNFESLGGGGDSRVWHLRPVRHCHVQAKMALAVWHCPYHTLPYLTQPRYSAQRQASIMRLPLSFVAFVASMLSLALAKSSTGDRVLVVLETGIQKDAYSKFWSSLECGFGSAR